MIRGLLFFSLIFMSVFFSSAQSHDNSLPGDLVISEVMANPVGLTELPETEYVEIYNASGTDMSLRGWKFIYAGRETELPDVVLPAGGYAVLFRSDRDIIVAEGAISLGIGNFPAALLNTGNTVGLKNPAGVMIDETSYPSATAGKSHERSGTGIWILTKDSKGGTPGAENSHGIPSISDPDPDPDPPVPPEDDSLPGDIVISEVMANPVGLTELPETEYVEIFNASETDINLKGWKFIYAGRETVLPDVVLPAGGYAVLFRSDRDIIVAEGALSLGIGDFPAALLNTGNTIGLKNSIGLMIDETSYPNATAGKSHERASDGTWNLTTDKKGGTPGEINSSGISPNPDLDPDPHPDPPVPPEDDSLPGDIVISEVMANPVGLTELPETEYVEIFNASGMNTSLKGWIFIYADRETALPDVVLPAGGYAVLYRSDRDIIVAEGALSLGISNFPAALLNTGNSVGLKNSIGLMIDETSYPNATAGKSHERASDGTWHLTTDKKGGTPGEINSSGILPNPDPDPDPNTPVPPEDNSKSGDILINEVMANPVGLIELPETEYVELFNASGMDINLSGWAFIYDGREVALPDVLFPDGDYAVLYRSGREMTVADGALSLGIDNFPAAIANTRKTIELKNSKGEVINQLEYPDATAGKSYERSDDGSWHLSTDEKGGTPGAENSPGVVANPDPDPNPPVRIEDNSLPGDILINEVMANPVGLVGLPETEYVEIYNASGAEISLFGWIFVYDGREIALPDVIFPDGDYAVLYRSGREIIVAAGSLSLGIANFPSALANTRKTIGLKNSKGEVIDQLEYPNATAGKSYERSNNGTWHLSTDKKGGTPGDENSPNVSTNPNPDHQPSVPQVDNSKHGDILINEVMANPVGLKELPETEYVEIFNASGSDISLAGWMFLYDGKESILPAITLPDGDYAVLYRTGRSIKVAAGALSIGVDKFPSALSNTGKTIGLKNSKGIIIDEYSYPKATAGKSHERSDNGAWHLSTDSKGGTPGDENSPYASSDPKPDPNPKPTNPSVDNSQSGDILINEVMANPVGLTELPETEYVELFNASEKDISLNGWIFIYDSREVALPDIVLPVGGYAVLYRAGREISVSSGALSVGIDKFPAALANTGKTISLKNSKDLIIDEITYPRATAGKSYERSDDGTWHLCSDVKGGTPGADNSHNGLPDTDPDTNPEDPEIPSDPTDIHEDNSQPGDILINEVMANPVGLTELPETEYVELFNASGVDMSIAGWVFVYDGRETNLPDTVLSDGGYAVLYRANREISVASGALSLGISNFPSALANTGRIIGLKNSKGVMIDEVEYPNATAGKSYERSDDGTWNLSTDKKGGTPGAINSRGASPGPGPDPNPGEGFAVDPYDIVINEILPNPAVEGSEYIELYNRSERELSLSGLVIAVRKADGSLSTHYPLSTINAMMPPEGYILLTKDIEGVTNFYSITSSEVIFEIKLPVLNNVGASIVLFRKTDEVIIDEVSYSEKWHDPSIKTKKGVSLERIEPDGNSQDASNWTSAAAEAGYGTPGYRNSQHKNFDIGNHDNSFINAPEYMPGMDFYILTYQTEKAGYRCRVEIYSVSGQKVAEISNNQLITQEGELRWDGKGLNNSRLLPGVYVFYAELYHPDGSHKKFKKAFLVK